MTRNVRKGVQMRECKIGARGIVEYAANNATVSLQGRMETSRNVLAIETS